MVPTAGRSCPTRSPSSAGGPLRSSPDPRMPVRSRSNQDVGSLNERLHGSTAADASPKISRKPSRVPRRGCCSPAFAYFLDVWQGPEIMGINIESDSKRPLVDIGSLSRDDRPASGDRLCRSRRVAGHCRLRTHLAHHPAPADDGAGAVGRKFLADLEAYHPDHIRDVTCVWHLDPPRHHACRHDGVLEACLPGSLPQYRALPIDSKNRFGAVVYRVAGNRHSLAGHVLNLYFVLSNLGCHHDGTAIGGDNHAAALPFLAHVAVANSHTSAVSDVTPLHLQRHESSGDARDHRHRRRRVHRLAAGSRVSDSFCLIAPADRSRARLHRSSVCRRACALWLRLVVREACDALVRNQIVPALRDGSGGELTHSGGSVRPRRPLTDACSCDILRAHSGGQAAECTPIN